MKRVILWGMVAILSGCASEPLQKVPAHPQKVWLLHAARMRAISHFQLSAEGGVRAGAHGGTLMLRWVLLPQAYQMTGYGPFGQLIFRLRVDGEGARLVTDHGRLQGAHPGTLLQRLTGWRLPVGGLRSWILGIPSPGPVGRLHVNRFGLLGSLSQAGWSIMYRRYRNTRWGRLPRFMTLKHARDAQDPVPVEVTIRIDQWRAA